jgi:hypothetical protein
MNARTLFQRGTDILAYLRGYASDFPPEDQTSVSKEISELATIVKLASDYVRTDDAKRWLAFCLDELNQALTCYQSGDNDKGDRLLDCAEQHFKDAREERASKPTFIVGPDGQAEKV